MDFEKKPHLFWEIATLQESIGVAFHECADTDLTLVATKTRSITFAVGNACYPQMPCLKGRTACCFTLNSWQMKPLKYYGLRYYREIAIFENNRITIKEQQNAIESFYKPFPTEFHQMGLRTPFQLSSTGWPAGDAPEVNTPDLTTSKVSGSTNDYINKLQILLTNLRYCPIFCGPNFFH